MEVIYIGFRNVLIIDRRQGGLYDSSDVPFSLGDLNVEVSSVLLSLFRETLISSMVEPLRKKRGTFIVNDFVFK